MKKATTRTALADAAIQLFAERGYDSVTMTEVAAQANVSRRTAFRYFPSKDDLVMQHPAEWLAVFNASVEEHTDMPLVERISIASHAVAAHIEANAGAVRQLFGLAFAHPSIAGRYAVNSAEWVDRIDEEIQRDVADATQARMLAALVMGIINTVCEIWAATDQPMTPLLETGLELIARSLPTTEPQG